MPKKTTIILLFALLGLVTKAQTDMTSAIVNPNFDGRSFAGWQQQGMQFQTNADFPQKANYAYVERWVDKASTLPDTYIRQTLTGLAKGRYTLTVGAQHILQESSGNATGACIFADWQETPVYAAGDYALTFDVLTDDVTIGFRCENSEGNWMACDNWRLTLVSTDVSYMCTGLANMVSVANSLAAQSMDASVKNALSNAISTASRYTTNGSASNIQNAATTLKTAMLAAERSIFATKTSTGGTVPAVSTNEKYARGATKIFCRSSVSSSSTILEQGFCYSFSNTEPTVADERTTRYVENGGRIYCVDNLQPGTRYYLRAYAVTTDYKVGYGKVISVYTLPKGNVVWTYGQEGDDLINARISQSAMGVAQMWSELTSITGANLNVHYASGTPTADCSYGGYIRVGPTESYQATGTLAHEMGHGIGVGTHSTYSGDIRTNNTTGFWLGKRVKRFLEFWDNSSEVRLYGDTQHVWASGAAQSLSYTINGAHEDNHGDASYYGNALLMQAMVEDGLAPVGGNLQGLAYTLDSDGNTFVIRNSDEDYGLRTSYLVDDNGSLLLKEMTVEEAVKSSNNGVWTLSFSPESQTYRIQNKQTGRYIYYASDNTVNGFRTTTATSNEVDLRLQLSFADVEVGLPEERILLDCYHIMRKNATPSPQAMCAKSSTTIASTPFSNTNAATTQRWVFVNIDELAGIQATMDREEEAEPGYDITYAMAPYLSTGSLKDWENNGMVTNYNNGGAPYTNPSDGARIDFPFIERWTSSTGSLDDTSIQQTLTELPDGYYYLRASFIATLQSDADLAITGVTFWAQDQSVSIATGNGVPKRYMLRVKVTDGTLSFGLKTASTRANWIAMDNFQLFYDGTQEEYMACATPCQPVRVPMKNATFDRWNFNGWTLEGNWQNQTSTYEHFNPPFAEWWVSNGSSLADRAIKQTLTLPAGYYQLQAAVEAVQQGDESLSVSGVTLRVDDEATACHTANHLPEIFFVDAMLEEGEHTLGLYVENTDANWVATDNFVLRYYGPNPFLLGDVNGDGAVTIADVTALVDIILGKSNGSYLDCAADVNGDGNITIADVTALVDIILGKAG